MEKMEQIKLNFFGEIVFIDIPKDLGSLRKQIAKLYSFNDQDASEILLTYKINEKQEIISNEEDLKTFLNSKCSIIDLDISQKSQIYQNSLNQLQEQSEKDKKILDDLLKQKEELTKLKETKFENENKQLKEINGLICDLRKRKKEIKKIICQGKMQIHKEKCEIEKKITEIQKKLGLPVSKPECHCPKKLFPKTHPLIGFPQPIHKHHHKHIHEWKKNFLLKPKNEKFMPSEKFNTINTSNGNEKKEIHFGFICDGCQMHPIIGKRYKCKDCRDFDFCENCYEKNQKTHGHEFKLVEKSIFKPITRIQKPWVSREKEIHFGFICDGCQMNPIVGKRYKCDTCKDFDFCEKCYEKNKESHGHKFNQIENPLKKFEIKEKKEIHHFVICDGCKNGPIIGKRYKCKGCQNFDYCEKCYEKNKLTHGHEFNLIEKPEIKKPIFLGNPSFFNHSFGHGFPMNPFFRAKKPENKHKKMEHCPTMGNIMNKTFDNKKTHFGVRCDGCGTFPIVGCRYKCAVCDNFDYCEECEKKFSQKHGHPLLKIRNPSMKVNIMNNPFKK